MKSIVEALAENAALYPDRLCIVDTRGEYSYQQIWLDVQKIAYRYIDLGIQKRDRIIIECTQDASYMVCGLAAQFIGAIMVPVEFRTSENNLEEIIQETDAKLLVCKTDYKDKIKSVYMNDLFNNITDTEVFDGAFPREEDTAEILYTTGTTGKSKGIELSNLNNIALAENIKFGTEMKEDNVELIPLPLSHSHGLRTCYANLYNGSTVILVEGMTKIKLVYELIMKYRVTALDLTPTTALIMEKLFGEKIQEFTEQIDYIEIGTAVLPEETKKMLIQDFPKARLYNFYGSTESGRTCVLNFNKFQNKKGCIGIPSHHARFIITDEHRNPIVSSESNPGLLASTGKMNMKGYWKQPQLTEEIMKNGYIYTNDLGYIDNEGYVYVLGRKDDVINCGGIKISPDEIEESTMKCSRIKDCACIPKKDKILGQVPKLYIVVDDEDAFQIKDFMKELKNQITTNKLPKEIKIITQIPRTYNGKIQRTKLIDLEE